jgi:hypothetical protein
VTSPRQVRSAAGATGSGSAHCVVTEAGLPRPAGRCTAGFAVAAARWRTAERRAFGFTVEAAFSRPVRHPALRLAAEPAGPQPAWRGASGPPTCLASVCSQPALRDVPTGPVTCLLPTRPQPTRRDVYSPLARLLPTDRDASAPNVTTNTALALPTLVLPTPAFPAPAFPASTRTAEVPA